MNPDWQVVHVVPALFGVEGSFGGAERYALELSRAMAQRVPTTLVTFGPKPARKQIGDLTVQVLRNLLPFPRFRFDPVNPLMLRYLGNADVIHYHQTHTLMSSLALVYARAVGKPIFTSHLGGGGIALHHYWDVTRWYAGHLHISEFSRRVFGHRDLATAKVIMGGVDPIKFSPDRDVRRTGEVLYVGRLLPHKGVNYLVEALDSSTPLTIVGRRWRHAQDFYDLLLRLSAGKNVQIHEDYDDAAIINAYRRALCVVLPSVQRTCNGEYHSISELLGQTVLEGMACGTPAICTNVCSLPELVEDGVSGFVVPPNDAEALAAKIRWLQTHPGAARQMGDAARQRVLQRFTWSQVADRCLEIYQQLARPSARPESQCA
jgi:glycosyltransferase involved in cell wall biosynthesis